jgi:deazaflavin-dependent oxidoreductase (nitroreductase family)
VADRAWPLLNRAAGLHTLLYRASGGRLGHDLPGLRGKILLLDHVGARSGTRRTTPLLYFRDGENLIIVASKGGFPRHPAWFHNLRANPETTVQVGPDRLAVRARVATDAERERLWPRAVGTYRGYADYQARSGDRRIPLVILEPRAA